MWNSAHLGGESTEIIHIAVLGGGMTPGEDVTPADQLSGDALNRIVEGVRIYHLVPSACLVTSGFSLHGDLSQAEILAATALDLGVSPRDTLWLPDPRTTREEAAAYKARFGKEATVILVTSALHLPRAMCWFRYNGLDPIPAPANHLVKITPDRWTHHWRPSMRKISIMQKVFHEYAGLIELAWVSRR
ncbi:MAG: YdcF family protein [Saprospiraceae bacterium]|nr:YdcF family protein [Saprospiraceae bacterium]